MLHNLFSLYDTNGDGNIDAEELLKMLSDYGKLTKSDIPTIHEVEVIIKSVDTNNDGLVQEDEFVDLVSAGIGNDPNFEQFVAEVTSVLGTVKTSRDGTAGLADNLRTLFNFYDRDGDGAVNAEELRNLLSDFGRHTGSAAPTMEEIGTVMERIETDDKGQVPLESFVKFITVKVENNPAFASFVSEMRAVVEGVKREKESGKVYSGSLEVKLHRLFRTYDVDGNGSIDAGELHRLLCDYGKYTGSAQPSLGEVTAFIKSVDKNGDGMLQEAEFVSFVARATERDSSFNGFMDKIDGVIAKVEEEYSVS